MTCTAYMLRCLDLVGDLFTLGCSSFVQPLGIHIGVCYSYKQEPYFRERVQEKNGQG